MSKRGMGLVGILVLLILLVIVLSWIFGTAIPAAKKLPETGQNLLIQAELVPAEYYVIYDLNGVRGRVSFNVWDKNQNSFVTDFHPITGYKISEDGIPLAVRDVTAFHNLYIALVVHPDLRPQCKNLLGAVRGMKFSNTYVGFSTAGKIEFKNKKDIADDCVAMSENYWSSVATAAKGLPSDAQSFNVLMIISDGCTQNCGSPEDVSEATQGLMREDINYVYRLTQDANNCNNQNNALNIIKSIVKEGKGVCTVPDSRNIATTLESTVKKIIVSYLPKKGFIDKHKIRVKVTKQNLAGTGEKEIDYAQNN